MKIPFTNFNLFSRAAPAVSAPVTRAAQEPLTEESLLSLVKQWDQSPPTGDNALRAIGEFTRLVRSYAAAATDEYNFDFIGTYGSANTEILPNLYSIRARARTLTKDTPQGRAIKRTYQNNVVGWNPFKLDMRYGSIEEVPHEPPGGPDGQPVPQPAQVPKTKKKFVADEDTNTAIEKFWKWYCRQENFTIRKTMSFMEAGRVVEAELVDVGSVLCRLYRDYPFNEIKFAVDFFESDRLQEQFVGKSGSDGRFGAGNPIRGSIEYQKDYNFPLAYWILRRHPGEFFAQAPVVAPDGQGSTNRNFREQVPAADIIHINNLRDRAEQDVGMTELDAAIQPIWRNHQFNKALVLCAIASHIRAFVLEKKLPTGFEIPMQDREAFYNAMANLNNASGANANPGGPQSDPAAAQQAGGSPMQVLRPGMERVLPPGVEAKILAPQFPTEQASEFRKDNHREVGIAATISYQHASGDFQNLGFIAGLMCQIPFQDWMKIRQEHLKECWLFRLFREALRAAILHGWFERRGYPNILMSKLEDYLDCADFKARRWAFVNPLVQAQTLILLMEAGIMSPQQVQDELPNGVSIEDLYAMCSEAKAEATKHGLDFSGSDVTRPGVPKGVPGQTVPNPTETEEGGQADKPPKGKTSNPLRTPNPGISYLRAQRTTVSTEALLAMSTNGEH